MTVRRITRSTWSLVHLIDEYDWRTAATVYLDVLPEMVRTGRSLLEAARAAPPDGFVVTPLRCVD